MTPAERRSAIVSILTETGCPVSATALAGRFSVSRQIIVGDIALLRAAGCDIVATPRGYECGHGTKTGTQHLIVCNHTPEQMADELNLIVDYGCAILDVSIEHPIYGRLTGELRISSRYEIGLFLERLRETDALPLSALTEGIHMHLISCPDDEVFDRLTQVLREKGYLLSVQ